MILLIISAINDKNNEYRVDPDGARHHMFNMGESAVSTMSEDLSHRLGRISNYERKLSCTDRRGSCS
jgi:hypothetical protein